MKLVFLFLSYAFLGWVLEVIFVSISKRKFINRGFLMGPFLPIYGYGALLVTYLLRNYHSDLFVLFFMSVIITGFLEYSASFFMEKIFNLRWWDYSNKKFHLNGRVTLENLFAFGFLSVLTIYYINPTLTKVYSYLNPTLLLVLMTVVSTVFITDTVISFILTFNVREAIGKKYKDSTDEIKKHIRKIYKQNTFYKRIVDAFPNFKKVDKD